MRLSFRFVVPLLAALAYALGEAVAKYGAQRLNSGTVMGVPRVAGTLMRSRMVFILARRMFVAVRNLRSLARETEQDVRTAQAK